MGPARSRLRWLACGLLAIALGACFGDDGDAAPDPGGEGAATVPQDPGAVGSGDPGDPAGPGVEPPNDGDDPMAMEPEQPSPGPGNTAGTPSAGAGAIAGGAPTPPPPTPGDAGAAPGDAGASALDCSALAECGASTPCEGGLHCIVLPSCMQARCIDPASACMAECGTPECAILESYPEQLGCGGT